MTRSRLGPILALAALCGLGGTAPLAGQRLAVEGLAGVELWQTDAGSRLLARNAGRLAVHAGVYGWASWRPAPRLELATLGYLSGGSAEAEEADARLELIEARLALSPALRVAGGRVLMPVGVFGARRFPHTNPVIGDPDLYPPLYPWGVVASGQAGAFDYRAAAVSLPVVNPNYTPEPAHRLRPLLGAGVTFGPALHAGMSWTHGPYLGPSSDAALPAGRAREDFQQTVVAADLRFSVGYVDVRAEAAWASYDVPTIPDSLGSWRVVPVEGRGWYVEPRVTLSPRVFVAARLEWFDYASIRVNRDTNLVGNATLEQNGELALGYRFSPGALLKVSGRRDNWPGPDASANFRTPNGYAFALQFSQQFSLTALLQR